MFNSAELCKQGLLAGEEEKERERDPDPFNDDLLLEIRRDVAVTRIPVNAILE